MQRPRNDEPGRSFVRTLAALAAAVVPSLVPASALAGRTDKAAGDEPEPAARVHVKVDVDAPRPAKKPKKAALHADAGGKKGKKTAHRADPDARRAQAKAKRCVGSPVAIDRGGLEAQSLVLLDCHGQPVEASQIALSVLARPWGAQKPAHLALPAHHAGPGKGRVAPIVHDGVARDGAPGPAVLAPGVRLVDKGVLVRLGAVAQRFPGRPISLVSGYRPQSRGSLHQSARALDLRVAGVGNEELVAFCRTLADTGCGYYPHSSFVHMDVRAKGTGPATWIDTSGPGESPHYVKQWPPPPEESDAAVLPPDVDPRDAAGGASDPWQPDPVDEHASLPAAAARPPAAPPPHGAGLAVSATPSAPPPATPAPATGASSPPASSTGALSPPAPPPAAPAVNHP